jgi:hypothetical protein
MRRPLLGRRPVAATLALAATAALVTGAFTPAAGAAPTPKITNQTTDGTNASAAAPDREPHYRQYTGERILGLPKKPACTVVMTKNYPMANTAYGPDEPYRGKFHPGDCAGDWTRIVAHVHTNVTGVQFDRIGWINLGGARIVTLSSQEPRGEGAGQVVQDETYDVTRYMSLFTDGSKVEFNIANVVTGPYTGIFYSDLSFEFYDDAATPLPDPIPDVVKGLPASTILLDPVSQQFSVPQNTTELAAELYVKASGGCDEFWWAAAPSPYQGQCDGYPIREIDVSIDGQTAGLVNTYPALFTGANGPSWWHPIPAPRAYDLRAYTVDLGPFIGTLTDGVQHTITYAIPERRWTDGNDVTVWSNLLITRNPDSKARTTGSVDTIDDGGVQIDDGGAGSTYEMQWTHELTVHGTTKPAGGTSVHRTTRFVSSAHTEATASSNDNRYQWITKVERGVTVRRDKARYHLVYLPNNWFLQDKDDLKVTDGGKTVRNERLRDAMHSITKAGTPTNRHSSERWSLATDGPLGCGTTKLVGENPNILKNKETDACRWGH